MTTELSRGAITVSSLLAFPGLALRLGLRYVVGRLVGTQVTHAGLTYDVGGTLQTRPRVGGTRRTLVLIVPSVVLVLVGLAFGVPMLLEMRLLGVSLVPESMSSEGLQHLVVERYVVRGEGAAMQMWCALSAWYAAALSRSELLLVFAPGPGATPPGAWARIGRACLSPFRALTRITDPLDRYLGVATGAVSLVLWIVVAAVTTRLLF